MSGERIQRRIVLADTPWYRAGPAQAKPPDGILRRGTIVCGGAPGTNSFARVSHESGEGWVAEVALADIPDPETTEAFAPHQPALTSSTELRWFLADDAAEAKVLEAALRARAEAVGSRGKVRSDWYARPMPAFLGVKAREGKLEVKVRLGVIPVARSDRIAGWVERWVKLSPTEGPAAVHERAPNVEVVKERWLVKIEAGSGAVKGEAVELGAACCVELTRLPRQRQLTVGLEAFGPTWSAVADAFDRGLAWLEGVAPDVTLGAADSCGYPEWIAGLSS